MRVIENCVEEATGWQKGFQVDDEFHETFAIANDLVVDWAFFGNRFQNVEELDHHVLEENRISTNELTTLTLLT